LNVVLLTIPNWDDLKGPNLPLNNEIMSFNKKLLNLKQLLPHVIVTEINENRLFCTQHGLCLNN
jgi:hypothetical protein